MPRWHDIAGIREAVLLFHVKHHCLVSCESSSGMSPGRLREEAALLRAQLTEAGSWW